MIYIISRIILFLAVMLICIYFFKKYSKLTVIKKIISFILSTVCLLMTMIFPIENLCIDFQSAEEAIKYSSFQTFQYSIDGDTSCLVFNQTYTNETAIKILPKKNEKYKIEKTFGWSTSYRGNWHDLSFRIYYCKGTQDYYVIVSGGTEDKNKFNISDEYGSEFVALPNNDVIENYIYYGAYVKNLDVSNYSLIINGEKVRLL